MWVLHEIQGQPTQTVFSKLALRDRNMQVRFFWKVLLKSLGLKNFGTTASFHEMYTVQFVNIFSSLVNFEILPILEAIFKE